MSKQEDPAAEAAPAAASERAGGGRVGAWGGAPDVRGRLDGRDVRRLQQTIGNRAVGRLMQRKLRVAGHLIQAPDPNQADVIPPKLRQALAAEAQSKKGRWSEEFVARIEARITSWIKDDGEHPVHKRQFGGYKECIRWAAMSLNVEAAHRPPPPVGPLPPLAPEPILGGPAAMDWEASLLGQIHDEASQFRLEHAAAIPDEFRVGAVRRMHQKAGTLDPSVVPTVSIGGFVGQVRLHGSVVTPAGGGRGREYAELWGLFTTALFGRSQQQAAIDIRAMLHAESDALLAYGVCLNLLDEILTIVVAAEQSRATGAVLYFAAAIHDVAVGRKSFVEAFSGNTASFLGAGEGGARALRHETPPWLSDQQERARAAVESYLRQFGHGATAGQFIARLMKNIASYSRKRGAQGASPAPSASAGAPFGVPGAPPT